MRLKWTITCSLLTGKMILCVCEGFNNRIGIDFFDMFD